MMIITSSQESNVEPHSCYCTDAIESKGLLRFLAFEETGFHKKLNVFKLSFFIETLFINVWGKKNLSSTVSQFVQCPACNETMHALIGAVT